MISPEKEEFLLSICIPTYNRAEILSKTIESIVSDPIFSQGKIELVISDNASTDSTAAEVGRFLEKHKNIKFFRNNENNGFMNIVSVLEHAHGKLLKVHNDYLIFRPGALPLLLEIARLSQESQPLIFLGNGSLKNEKTIYLNSFDEFMNSVSFWCTFAGGFCIWKSDYSKHREIKINRMFPHTSLLFANFSKSSFWVDNSLFFDNHPIKAKGGYNVFNVFAVQFLDLIIECKAKKIISEITFKKIKRDLFFNFLVRWYCTMFFQQSTFTFDTRDARKSITTYYSTFEYFLLIFLARLRSIGYFALRFLN